ncbi:TVP38/TMEM64 family protein [Niallia endozanthoxylica]|uniref:TVP38/TMEM64 family protein n=1 Tax=Niallia endozanthoxylica TaxID=2036016 RepID=A0A5J5HNS3_9BACI|nr:VTT domain-containing protein [Niallia endozanthoxylica]KAA9023200.1 TVP38/TMEM64 family protein [Niallia endozanthoxylica]
MDESLSILFILVKAGGILAPIAFILFHILRQFLFIPVTLVCMTGGILFGSVLGTIYSLIGLMISSVCFYFVVGKLPKTHEKLSYLKKKWFGEYRNITVAQTAILRLIPFIHYHLLNFCLIEKKHEFKAYVKNCFFSNLPLAFFFSVFGQFIRGFTPTIIAIILFSLMILAYLFREKASIIKWREFFKTGQA